MFSGIISTTVSISKVWAGPVLGLPQPTASSSRTPGARWGTPNPSHPSILLVKCSWNKPLVGVQEGESLALDGICLTVTKVDESGFEADLSSETLEKTTAKFWKEGGVLNVERALKYQDLVGGHLVSGHVDAVGEIIKLLPEGDFFHLRVKIPSHLEKYVVEKGCIAIDGVSLTVNRIENRDVAFMLIPYTIAHTSLKEKKKGSYVNIEVDLMAKYALKIRKPL